MKAKILLCSMLILGSLSYAAETDSIAKEVMSEVQNIEAEYQALMQKEMERKEEFRQEKETLEKEVQELKERSPSCGSSYIYDGSFSGKVIEGQGFTTIKLNEENIIVFSEENLEEIEKYLQELNK